MGVVEERDISLSEHEIRSVLLLDNDVDLADTLKQLLETRNYVVTTVSNGVEGLREVMELDFDIIICDLMMPQMPGDMFYLAVQRTKPHLCSRFIFITGHSGNPRVDRFLDKTEGYALMKPIMMDDLIKTIGIVLSNNNKQPASGIRSSA